MMKYDLGKGEFENWIVAESDFSKDYLGKAEAIMSLGNGYMGLRSATEEPYIGEVRNLLVAGTFNKFDEAEVTELPNAADVTRLDIRVDGERLDVTSANTTDYVRALNLKVAELTRTFTWTSAKGKKVAFSFRRFVSLHNLHLIGMKVEVKALTSDVEISIESGVNAQLSNSGSQHFQEGEKRIHDKKIIELLQKTTQSENDFVITAVHSVDVDGTELQQSSMRIDRRVVALTYKANVAQGSTLSFEKLAMVYTSVDKEFEGKSLKDIREIALSELRSCAARGYDALFEEHVQAWERNVWQAYKCNIESSNGYDVLSMRFALYHLTVMTPAHDARMGVAAKGLSGEGYKGHSFWDTEIFITPFFTFFNPDIARSLLTYRYLGLEGAHKKAAENGYRGAMYPWEAAWPTDGEVTPVWGAVDIVTGEQTKIWSGFIEQHITSDIAYAVWQYYMVTNDQQFMNECGYEILFDTAIFWASRLEWNEEAKQYHINDVIGPDEYKEHVNNNAFTNHMAHFNIELAMKYYESIKQDNAELFNKLNSKLNLDAAMQEWTDKINKIYLPSPRDTDLVVPQDDTYLDKKIIDLSKYKNQSKVGSMFDEYNLEQVNDIQVSKQADIMILFYLLENRFSEAVKIANYNYYEPKTLHDSSLSLSTHVILASDLNDRELAYNLFKRACEIDLGPNMKTSDHGIHSASIGGIMQGITMGFAGIRMVDGKLRMNPKLPSHWDKLELAIHWQGQELDMVITQDTLEITAADQKLASIEVNGQMYDFNNKLTLQY